MKTMTIVILFLNSVFFYAHAEDVHIIKKGETVYQLSKKYGIPVEVLLDANDIGDPSIIPEGQPLHIPSESSSIQMESYTVKKGDTLYSIAHNNGITLYQLRALNPKVSDAIKIGQVVVVPLASHEVADASINDDIATRSSATETDEKKYEMATNEQSQPLQHNSFSVTTASELMKNAQLVGEVSDKWPVSGIGYMLQGKLPGVLIEGKENQTVQAMVGGIVVYAALHTTFKNVLVIQGEDGVVYVYAGQKSLLVKQGDVVSKGSIIGTLGIMPTLQKPVLYFSLWYKNRYLDPRSKIG